MLQIASSRRLPLSRVPRHVPRVSCIHTPHCRPVPKSIYDFRKGGARSRQVQCQGLFGLGLPEIAVIAGVAALIFGPSKLPELGRGLGKTVKSFQNAAKEFETELKAAASEDESKAPEASTAKEADKEKVGKSSL